MREPRLPAQPVLPGAEGRGGATPPSARRESVEAGLTWSLVVMLAVE